MWKNNKAHCELLVLHSNRLGLVDKTLPQHLWVQSYNWNIMFPSWLFWWHVLLDISIFRLQWDCRSTIHPCFVSRSKVFDDFCKATDLRTMEMQLFLSFLLKIKEKKKKKLSTLHGSRHALGTYIHTKLTTLKFTQQRSINKFFKIYLFINAVLFFKLILKCLKVVCGSLYT